MCSPSFQFTDVGFDYLITVGMTSAVNRMQREAVAWEANRPSTEKMVMAVSLRSKGHKDG